MPLNRLLSPFPTVAHAAEGLSDADLVARFLADRNPVAFEALVWRHGPMVRAVCRSVLRNRADADDAFQATFLVLSHKAASIRRPAAVGGWLYGVAVRVARKLKRSLARFPVTQDLTTVDAAAAMTPTDDLWPVIDDEIQRLPESCRAVVHLCYVAGLTTAEAGERLGVPKGTVLSRLARGRARLQARLTRRGVTAGVTVLTSAATTATARLIDPHLVRSTVQAAVGGALPATMAVATQTAFSLSQGVISEMALHKLRVAILTVAVGLSAAGLGVSGWAIAGGGDGPKPGAEKKTETAPPPGETPPPLTPPSADSPKDARPKGEDAPKAVTMQDILSRLERQEKLNQDLRKELERLTATPAGATPPTLTPPAPVSPPADFAFPGVPPKPDNLPAAPPTVTPSVSPLPPPLPDIALPSPVVPTSNTAVPEPRPGGTGKNGTMTIAKPGGTWYRASGEAVCSLTFTEDRLTITNDVIVPGGEKGAAASRRVTVTVEADYAVSKDGVVFGYVTGVDAPEGGGGAWQALEEQPFAFRFRADEKVLTVKDVKLRRSGAAAAAPPPGAAAEVERLLSAGRYTDKKPAVAPFVPPAELGPKLPVPDTKTLPSPRP